MAEPQVPRGSFVNAAGSGAEGHEGDITYHDMLLQEVRAILLLRPDVAAAKTIDKGTSPPGETLNSTVTARNEGAGDARQLSVTDTLPPARSRSETSRRTCIPGGPTRNCSLSRCHPGRLTAKCW